jgi:hypothetical protein
VPDLTPSERALVQPRGRSRVRPYFRLACVLLVAAMIPLPWSRHTGCGAHLNSYTVIQSGQDLLLEDRGSLFPTLVVLILAIAAPWVALRAALLSCLLADLFCFIGLFFFSAVVALKIGGPSSTPLPAGQAALVTLVVTTIDSLVALFMDAGADPPARAPDDTG